MEGERERAEKRSGGVEAGHDHVERGARGGEPKRGREVRVPRGKRNEREEGQVAPFIVGQLYGAGHTWLLPGKCRVKLRQNTNIPQYLFN